MPRSLSLQSTRSIIAAVLLPAGLAILIASSAGLFEPRIAGKPVRPDERTPSRQEQGRGGLRIPQEARAVASHQEQETGARLERMLVERALGELRAELRREGITRSEWERTLRAIAGGLGPETRPALLEICGEQRGREERVAAFELARLRAQTTPESVAVLAPSQLAWLATLLRQDDLPPALEAAACRSMVAFGGREDRLALVDRLRSSPSEQARTAAAWGLEAARDGTTIVAIADAMTAGADARGADLAAATIGEILHSAEPASLGPYVTGTLEELLASTLENPGSAATLRRRAVRALESLGGWRARASFSRLLEQGEENPELARLAGQAMARMDGDASMSSLADAILNGSPEGEMGFLAAEALMMSPSTQVTDAAVRHAATERMSHAVANHPRPSKRRRALLALAQSQAGFALPTIVDCVRSDADATVRAAAIVALEQLDAEGAFDRVLESQQTLDSSPDVRALARQALNPGWH